MQTQYFDDGSSLTHSEDYGYLKSTPATDSATGIPSFPNGNQVLQALSSGFGRWIDYKTTTAQPQVNVPTLPRTPAANSGGGLTIGSNTLLLIGLGLGLWALAK